jgi:phosphatidate cytidylyltransferase
VGATQDDGPPPVMSSLTSRLVVGAALLPGALGIVWLGGWWLAVLALLGGLMGLHELYTMARAHRPLVLAGYAGLIAAVLGAQLSGTDWLFGGILAGVAFSFVVFGFSASRPSATAAFGTTALGVLWVGGGLGLLLLLRDIPGDGRLAILTVMLAVFADDTAAFFVGRAIGRHRMAPRISPKKSWEGFVAGTAAAVLVCFFALYEQNFLSSLEAVMLGVVVAAAAALGDLFESAVKRDLGAKDSGRVLAAHGGVLDRIDSLLWAGPAAFYTILAFT